MADAFSAMTTTRPYRKALSVQEALKRLGAAAGTKLEERLAREFISGMETAHDAPLPGDDAVPGLWIPRVGCRGGHAAAANAGGGCRALSG